MPMALVHLGMVVLFVTPAAVKFSVWRANHGCGNPISMRILRRVDICLAVMKRAASSGVAMEDMTNLMNWTRVRSGPLFDGIGTSSERNIWYPAWLWALISL